MLGKQLRLCFRKFWKNCRENIVDFWKNCCENVKASFVKCQTNIRIKFPYNDGKMGNVWGNVEKTLRKCWENV